MSSAPELENKTSIGYYDSYTPVEFMEDLFGRVMPIREAITLLEIGGKILGNETIYVIQELELSLIEKKYLSEPCVRFDGVEDGEILFTVGTKIQLESGEDDCKEYGAAQYLTDLLEYRHGLTDSIKILEAGKKIFHYQPSVVNNLSDCLEFIYQFIDEMELPEDYYLIEFGYSSDMGIIFTILQREA